MSTRTSKLKHPIAILIAATVTSGALAAVITDQVLSHRAIVVTDDGSAIEIELIETPVGSAGSFTSIDGTEYHVNVEDDAEQGRTVTLDVEGPGATGTVSVGVSDDPNSVLTRRPAPVRDVEPDEDGADR